MSEMQRDGSEMRCKRCGANESRIHGFCSVECEHYFDYEEEITDLNARIAELEAKQRWRVVADGELPNKNDYYWARDDLGQQGRILFYDGEWNKFTNLSYITHWMPLPPNPESPNDTQSSTFVYGKESD